jgi:uncharacterized protein involved in response to NO
VFAAGYRPFFLLAGLWSAIAIPVWLCAYAAEVILPSVLPPVVWHVHEMVFGFAFASVAGFLLTAIPNWTGRLPLRGWPLATLACLWLAGRAAVLLSGMIGALPAAVIDLSFPAALIAVVAREIVAGRNWRNLPMVAALSLLAAGSLLVHLHALGVAYLADVGNRLGVATLAMLIALVGGRIVPSFTRNWLARMRPRGAMPAQATRFDIAALAVTFAALASWVAAPLGVVTPWLALAAGAVLAIRLSRWCGLATLREPLLFVLHAGYGWLAIGLLLLGANGFLSLVPASVALHALTVGAIGTMTLAVMTRATLGHSGRPVSAGHGTTVIFALVTLAAVLRLAVPMAGAMSMALTWSAGAAWSAAFGMFVLLYGGLLLRPDRKAEGSLMQVKPIPK